MSTHEFDYFIIGTGPAGQSVAKDAAKAGHSVGICDYRPFGGTCPLRGCDPKKVFYAVAEAMNAVQRLRGKGFTDAPTLNWADLQAFKTSFTEKIPPGTREKFDKQGITHFSGKARFTAPHELMLNDDIRITAHNVVIATGAIPAPLDFPGAELMKTSDAFLDLEALPETMIIVGGGYIGCEFAHMSTVLGSKVTVIASEENPVAKFDRDLNSLMARAARERGMTLHFSSKASKVEKADDGRLRVTMEKEDGSEETVTAHAVFHCAGRVPNIKALDLDKAGIDSDKQGIKVNNRLCTRVRAHYALGDCASSGLDLTPVASHEARILTANLFDGGNEHIDYYPIPTVAFTLPPITAVGMTAEEADESDRNLHVNYKETTDGFHTAHQNGIVSGYKVIVDKDEDTIVGAHIYGPDAQEVINLFALAIYEKTSISSLQKRLWAYPTLGSHLSGMVGY